jgi:simple sugar transport system substrate-binding protein
MSKKVLLKVLGGLLAVAFMSAACAPKAVATPAPEPTKAEAPAPTVAPTTKPEDFVFGMLMVGPYNDHGWSQAHYDAGLYVEEKVPGVKMIYLDKVNVADRPGTTPAQLGEELVTKGAKLVIFNSDDMKDSAHEFALAHPDIIVVHASGDGNWAEGKAYKNIPNLANIMGRMEYGKMIAGCAAAMTTTTGKIGYLGPLINDETRRLASSAFIGARYCWENYAKKDPAKLTFEVKWIGFWFNIPGVTSDPTQVADEFFNNNFDVVLSGIDTTEAITEAVKMRANGKNVFAIPYDYKNACDQGVDACLGVPYFNWGPAYVEVIKSAKDGTFKPFFTWNSPDWKDLNNPDTSAVGFVKGKALSAEAGTAVDKYIAELAAGLKLKGPLNLQDGTVYLKEGETATDYQIWYLPQLLQGMVGLSTPAE